MILPGLNNLVDKETAIIVQATLTPYGQLAYDFFASDLSQVYAFTLNASEPITRTFV